MSQKQLIATRNLSQPLPDDKSATLLAEALMCSQMHSLANQLKDLVESILRAGLQEDLHQTLQGYFQLATRLWEEAAANRLDELARDPAYRADMEKLEQHIECLQERCPKADQKPHARMEWRWKRRVWLYRQALEEWLDCVGDDTDTMLSHLTKCGRILYHVRGYLGLASCNRFEYAMIKGLQIISVLVNLSLVLPAIYLVESPNVYGSLPVNIAGALIILSIPAYLLWFCATKTSFSVIIGYTLTRQPAPGTTMTRSESKALTQFSRFSVYLSNLWNKGPRLPDLLRFWLWCWGILGGLFFLLLLLRTIIAPVDNWSSGFVLIANNIAFFSLICIFFSPLIVLPYTLTMQVHMCKELKAPERSPEARRSALYPAMKLLSFHTIIFTIILLIIAYVVLGSIRAISSLSTPIVSTLFPTLTWLALVYLFLVAFPIVLLYVLCLEYPYRRGLQHWKTGQLIELAVLRRRFDRLLKEASSLKADREPYSPQGDYALWQYYRTREEDVKQIASSAFSFLQKGRSFLFAFTSSTLVTLATDIILTVIQKQHGS